jgi:hypothetical protein
MSDGISARSFDLIPVVFFSLLVCFLGAFNFPACLQHRYSNSVRPAELGEKYEKVYNRKRVKRKGRVKNEIKMIKCEKGENSSKKLKLHEDKMLLSCGGGGRNTIFGVERTGGRRYGFPTDEYTLAPRIKIFCPK